MRNVSPKRSLTVKLLHQRGVLLRDGVVVIVDEQRKRLMFCAGANGTHVSFKPRNDLLKSLFVDRL